MATFSDRKRALFDCLRQAEKQAMDKISMPPPIKPVHNVVHNIRKMRHETKHFRGQKSLYLRNEEPNINKHPNRRMANHKKNSDKWTYYNMENVPELTERSNAEAAAACMNEMRLNGAVQKSSDDMETNAGEFKLKFALPIRENGEPTSSALDRLEKKEKTVFVNSKMILPEYVIGEKPCGSKKPKKNVKTGESSNTNLKLDHLYEDDEDDDDK